MPSPRFRREFQFIQDTYERSVQTEFDMCPACSSVDDFYADPHYCPVGPSYENDMNQNAICAARCADKCALEATGCDAYSYIPGRCQLAATGETSAVCPRIPAFCAMYDFDDDIDGVVGQLDCEEFQKYGGGFPYGQDLFWKSTALKPTAEESWCLDCCDNRRMSRDFKDTFVMRCDYDVDKIGLALGIGYSLPTTIENDMSDVVFRFAARPTIDDVESVTSCVLNRHLVSDNVNSFYKRADNYLIGYNLTIGVTEYRSGVEYWKGVSWCYAEPIVSTRNYWEKLRSEDTVKFLEIITITNLPDPLKAQSDPPPAWHAWRRRLGRSLPRGHAAGGFDAAEWAVIGAVCIALYATLARVGSPIGGRYLKQKR